jgi:hypothetical protein
LLGAILFLALAGSAGATPAPSYSFATPVFGIATQPDGSLLVADYGAGIVELRKGDGRLVAELPTVTDVAPIGRGEMFAVTGLDPTGQAEEAQKLFRVSRGRARQIADLLAFETTVNPDGAEINSNPFDVAALNGGKALVADAGANDLLIVDNDGRVDWVARFPEQIAATDHLKDLVGCPAPVPGFEWVCGLPAAMPAQAVATSIAIGPDGAYYVGELTGIPAPTGMSRVWRVEPGTLHADCATSPACSVVAAGFTSIVDLSFGAGGDLYVVELDEATWAAVEFQIGGTGGTINRCDSSTWACTEVAAGLPIPTATTAGRDGTQWAAIWALVPGLAQIVALP